MILLQVGLGLIALAYAMIFMIALGVIVSLFFTKARNNSLTVYEKIKQGMTFNQVEAIIGAGYSFEMQESYNWKYALWTVTHKTAGSSAIQVVFGAKGGAVDKNVSTKKADGTYDSAETFNASNNGW